jgi:L-lactate dehydrogenase complex protein LldE
MKVLLFPTCLPDVFFPHAIAAAQRVLSRAGCEVEFRRAAVCCGQPAWNSGHLKEARRVAVGALEAMRGDEPIVSCSGSCTSMVHEYWPELFAETKWEHQAAEAAERVHEFSDFVVDVLGLESIGAASLGSETVVGYHDSCHMMRMLGIKEAPRALLSHIGNLRLTEMAASERCCGFGGTFSIRYPELSGAMADEKVNDASAHDITRLVACDLGCLMHICGPRRAGLSFTAATSPRSWTRPSSTEAPGALAELCLRLREGL